MLRIVIVLVVLGAFEYQQCRGDKQTDDWRSQGFYRPRRNYPSQNNDKVFQTPGQNDRLELAQNATRTFRQHSGGNTFGTSNQNTQNQSPFGSSNYQNTQKQSPFGSSNYRNTEKQSPFGSTGQPIYSFGSQNARDTLRTSFSQNQNAFRTSNQNQQGQNSFGINSQSTFRTAYSQNSAIQNDLGLSGQSSFSASLSQNSLRSDNGQNLNIDRSYNNNNKNSFGNFGQNLQSQNSFASYHGQNTFSNFGSNSAAKGQNYQGPDYLPPKRYMGPEYLPPHEPTTTKRPYYTSSTTRRSFYMTSTTKGPIFTTTTTKRPIISTTTVKMRTYNPHYLPAMATQVPPEEDDDDDNLPEKRKIPTADVAPAMATPVPPEPEDDGGEIFPEFTTTTRKPAIPAPALAIPVPPEEEDPTTTTTSTTPSTTTTTTSTTPSTTITTLSTTTTTTPSTTISTSETPSKATRVPSSEDDDNGDENLPEKRKIPTADVAPAMATLVPPEPEDEGGEIFPEFTTTTRKPAIPAPALAIPVPPEEEYPTTTTISTTPSTTTTITSTTPSATTSTTTIPSTTTSTTPSTTTTTSTTPSSTTTTTTSTTPSTTTSTTTTPSTTTSTTPITTSTTTTPSTTTSTTPSTTTTTGTTASTTASTTISSTPDPNRNLIEEESISTTTPPTPSTTSFKAPEYLPPDNTTVVTLGTPPPPAPAMATPVPPEPECDPLDPSTYPSELDQRNFRDNPCAPITTTIKPPYRGPLYLPPPPDKDLCEPKTRARRSTEPTLRLADLKGTPRPVWYAGIYKKVSDPYYPICGGSIVREDIVISAAHCFWNDEVGKERAELFAVAASKIYKPWKEAMDKKAQKSDVLEITIPPRYLGVKASFQEDIAILRLAKPFHFTRGVKPICIDFDVGFDREQMKAGHYGTFAGWGYTDSKGTPTQRLLWLELPYIEIEKCIRDSKESFLKYITSDKVCAGENDTGRALCRGDSGGGLAFWRGPADRATPYLRGVASTAPTDKNAVCNVFAYASFTHIFAHRTFLRDHLPGIDNCRFWE